MEEELLVQQEEAPQSEQTFQSTDGMTKLGKKLNNPYSLENMRNALANLQNSSAPTSARAYSEIEIKPTHLYVRFKPKTEEELDLLNQDSTLILFSYPLDYEILEGGSYYHDPAVPKNQPTYQYCSVPVGKELPSGVEHEVIEELFNPEDMGESRQRSRVASEEVVDQLLYEALKITGNLTEEEMNNSPSKQGRQEEKRTLSRYNPEGRIRVWDPDAKVTVTERIFVRTERRVCGWEEDGGGGRDIYGRRPIYCNVDIYENVTRERIGGYIPIHDIDVIARTWHFSYRASTDRNGDYRHSRRFSLPVHNSIKWKKYHFSIRAGDDGQAEKTGPEQRSPWILNIPHNDLHQFYAFIYMAGQRYYYHDILGLKRPPENANFKPQMKIDAYDGPGRGYHHRDIRIFGRSSWVHVYRYRTDGKPETTETHYTTTLHELAHASHWELRKNNWYDGRTTNKLIESWAMGVQWSLARLKYPNYDWGQHYSFSDIINSLESRYTSLIIDLIDDNDQSSIPRISSRPPTDYPLDRVKGYTIAEIEAVLDDCSDIWDLKDRLYNEYPNNPTRGNLHYLFDQYDRLSR